MSGGWVDGRVRGGKHLLSRPYAGLGAGAEVFLGLSSITKGPCWSGGILEMPCSQRHLRWGVRIVLNQRGLWRSLPAYTGGQVVCFEARDLTGGADWFQTSPW